MVVRGVLSRLARVPSVRSYVNKSAISSLLLRPGDRVLKRILQRISDSVQPGYIHAMYTVDPYILRKGLVTTWSTSLMHNKVAADRFKIARC
jgi:hypothetical protein